MTNGNEFKLGGKNANSVDLAKLKSGAKRADFESDAKMLKVFDAIDSNSNQTLDMDEVTVFTDGMKQAANGDDTITKKEAEQIFQNQQQRAKAAGEDAKKYDVKSKDLFDFVNKFLNVSENSPVKSSVVDENGNQTLTYEDGSQEILNKDGSKILIQVIDGKKVSRTFDKDDKPTEVVYEDEESGETETLSYENGKIKSHVIQNGNTTTILGVEDGFSKGKPVKQIIGKGTENEREVKFEHTGEKSYTASTKIGDITETVTVNDGVVESTNKAVYKNGVKVQEISVDKDRTQTSKIYDANGKLKYDSITTVDGKTTETTYNESGRKLQSVITTPDGKVKQAKYDGKGNTIVVVQNGETIDKLGKKFDRTTAELAQTNKGHVYYNNGKPYFTAGQEVKVSGEFDADFNGLQGRLSSEQVKAQYEADEQSRIAQRLDGKELKEVEVGKDYANLTEYAKDLLRSELGREPSKEEYTNKANELGVINGSDSIVPKKGMKLNTTKSEAELKQERGARALQEAEAKELKEKQAWKAKMEKAGAEISNTIYTELRRTEFSTVGNNQNFKTALNKIYSQNVVEVIRAYDKKSPDESLVEAISDETTSSGKAIASAETHIFNALYSRARSLGYNNQELEDFKLRSDYAIKKNNSELMETLMYDMVQAIENRENLTHSEVIEAKYQTFTQSSSKTVQLLQDEYDAAKAALDDHKDRSGWSAGAVHYLREGYNLLWDVEYSPSQMDKYMKEYKADIDRLKSLSDASAIPDFVKQAQRSESNSINIPNRSDEELFKSKFKSTFGVYYDPVKIAAYNKKREEYQAAAADYALQKMFDNKCAKLIKGDGALREETSTYTSTAGTAYVTTSATKQQVYDRELKNFASAVAYGDEAKGLEFLNGEMKKAGIDPAKASIDEKYKFLSNKAKTYSSALAEQTKKSTGGKSFDQVQKEYEHSYAGAFGARNNAHRKVTQYVDSVESSAAILRTGVKIAGGVIIGVATGGTGFAAMATAAGAQTALTFAVDAGDLATSKRGGTAEQYLTIAGQSVVDGVSQIASGGASQIIKSTTLPVASKILLNTAADTVIDMGVEYINTGDITLESTLMSAVMSGVGNTISSIPEIKQEYRARQISKELEDAIDNADLSGKFGDTWQYTAEDLEKVNPDHVRTHVPEPAVTGKVDASTIDFNTARRTMVEDAVRKAEAVKARSKQVVTSLDPKGKMFTPEFNEGLQSVVARSAVALEENEALGKHALAGLNERGSKVTSYGVYKTHEQVKAMGLQSDVSLVHDCQVFATGAYGELDEGILIHGEKPVRGATDGWERLMSYTDESNGFHANAFEKDGKIIIAFRGSDEVRDLVSDFSMLEGKIPEQLRNATDFVAKIKEMNPDAKIIVTGHSLGGALTELVSSEFDDVLGISFDAVGTKQIVEKSGGLLKDNNNTINYIIKGDEISNAYQHVGNTVVMDGQKGMTQHAVQNFSKYAYDGVEAGMVEFHTGSAYARAASFDTLEYALRTSADGNGKVKFNDKQFKTIKQQFEYDVNTYGADLSSLREQIGHVSDASQREALTAIIEAREATIQRASGLTALQKRIAGEQTSMPAPARIVERMTGDDINYTLKQQYGITQSAFGDTPGAKIVFEQETTMVRVFNDESSFAKGSWLMAYEDLTEELEDGSRRLLTPEQIKEKFALPALPKYVTEVKVPAGAEFITGSCIPVENVVNYDYAGHGNIDVLNWGKGGGTQYFFTGGNRPVDYVNMRRLPGVK